MKILPETTHPPKSKIERKHSPREGRYRKYRQCLRWEFGFACAFCLLHEGDFVDYPAEGTGLTWIEHYVPRKEDKTLANVYSNCFYSCYLCNQARSDMPVHDADGGSILSPVDVAWAEHFEASDNQLKPKTTDAVTTERAYALNGDRKQERRATRRKRITKWLQDIREKPSESIELSQIAANLARSDDPMTREQARKVQKAALDLLIEVRMAREELQRYLLIATDARRPCSCGEQSPIPPSYLDEQGIVVEN